MREGLHIVLIISWEPEGQIGLTVSQKQFAISKPIKYVNSIWKVTFGVRCNFLLWHYVQVVTFDSN